MPFFLGVLKVLEDSFEVRDGNLSHGGRLKAWCLVHFQSEFY